MGTNGSVSFLFEQKGMIRLPVEEKNEEEFMLEAIEAGADDIQSEDDFFVVYTTREDLFNVRKALEEGGHKIDSAELVREAMTETKVDPDTALSNLKMMDKFEENDDVTNVFTNMLMDDETLKVAEEL